MPRRELATEALIERWLAAPVNRAVGWVTVLAFASYGVVAAAAAAIGPRLPYLLDVPLFLGIIVATVVVAQRARAGRSCAGPIRFVIFLLFLGLGLYMTLGDDPGELIPWVAFFAPGALAVVVFGWDGWMAVVVGTTLAAVATLANFSDRYGRDAGAAFADFAFFMVVVLASGFASAGLRRSLSRRAEAERDVRQTVSQAEATASAVHMHGYWAGVIHDHALSVLRAAALLTEPTVPTLLASEAADARRRLEEPPTSLPCRMGELAGWIAQAGEILPSAQLREQLDNPATLLPGEVAAGLLAATEESLRNIVRHAGRTDVEVGVFQSGRGVVIEVRDHGVGFDPAQVSASRLGLRVAVAERMNMVGGHGRWFSTPGDGTTIVLSWRADMSAS